MRASGFGIQMHRFAALAIGLAAWAQAQQVIWQTTHTKNVGGGYNSGLCNLAAASLRVRVHPAFLDIEEDVEIGPVGGVSAGNDGNSLEIVGSITLPPGGAVIGALLWDGSRVLQGKLLDRNIADSLYEDLVDRNSTPPPRPRDPLILERTGPGSYRFRIYPVAVGFSRHMRVRYQMPPVMGALGLQIPFKAPVASSFAGSNLQVPVTLENAGSVPKAIFSVGENSRTEMTLPRTRLMTPGELGDGGYGWDVWGNPHSIPGLAIQPVTAVRQAAVKTAFEAGQMAGHYLNLYATVSQEVLKGLNLRSAASLAVVVRNAKKSYDVPVACEGGLAVGCGSATFNGKSDLPWEDSLQWEAYDAAGKLLAATKIKSTVYENPEDTGAAVLWAASEKHFSERKELPLGPVFGFVDEWASLLSLPGDSIEPALLAYYEEHGLPRIANASLKDVIPNYEEGQVSNPGNPVTPDPWAGNPTTLLAARLGVLADPSAWRLERLQGGFIVRIAGLAPGLQARVELYDLAGKRAGVWTPRSEAGALNLSSAAVRPGLYVLKVSIGASTSVKRIVL